MAKKPAAPIVVSDEDAKAAIPEPTAVEESPIVEEAPLEKVLSEEVIEEEEADKSEESEKAVSETVEDEDAEEAPAKKEVVKKAAPAAAVAEEVTASVALAHVRCLASHECTIQKVKYSLRKDVKYKLPVDVAAILASANIVANL